MPFSDVFLGPEGRALAELVRWQGDHTTNVFGAEIERRSIDGVSRWVYSITPRPANTYVGLFARGGDYFVVAAYTPPNGRARAHPAVAVGAWNDPYDAVWRRIESEIRCSATLKLAAALGATTDDRWRAVADALGYWRDEGIIADFSVELGEPGGFHVVHPDGSTNGGTPEEWWRALSSRPDWPFHVRSRL